METSLLSVEVTLTSNIRASTHTDEENEGFNSVNVLLRAQSACIMPG